MWDPKETLDSVGLGRSEQKRSVRVADLFYRELSMLLLGKVRDPKLAEVSLTRVELTDDLKLARIYFTLPGSAVVGKKAAIKAMERAGGFMRSHLARTLNMRYTPALAFFYDTKAEKAAEMDQLFQEIAKERREHE